MDDLRDQIAEALATNRWGGDHDRDTHARHNYLYSCGICQGDVRAIADAVMAVVGPELVRLHDAAWIVPKVEHDPHALVGPRILNSRRIPGTWIYREQGNSDPDHTRTYAAQLLAAADEVEREGTN